MTCQTRRKSLVDYFVTYFILNIRRYRETQSLLNKIIPKHDVGYLSLIVENPISSISITFYPVMKRCISQNRRYIKRESSRNTLRKETQIRREYAE